MKDQMVGFMAVQACYHHMSGILHNVQTVQYTMYTAWYTLYTIHCTLLTVYYTRYMIHCILYNVHCKLYSLDSRLQWTVNGEDTHTIISYVLNPSLFCSQSRWRWASTAAHIRNFTKKEINIFWYFGDSMSKAQEKHIFMIKYENRRGRPCW